MDNTKHFSGKAGVYDKYRPSYPKEFVDYLMERSGVVPGDCVADVGCGTGIFSRVLLERGLRVYGVEPNADMRAAAERALGERADFVAVDAPAERMGLADGSVALVTAAQAFHWFEVEAFAAECRRVLRKGGVVALVWNSRVSESDQVRETGDALKRLCPTFDGFSGRKAGETERLERFFREGRWERREFFSDLSYDREGFLGRLLSASYAPLPNEASYEMFCREMNGLFDAYAVGDRILVPNRTESFVGRV